MMYVSGCIQSQIQHTITNTLGRNHTYNVGHFFSKPPPSPQQNVMNVENVNYELFVKSDVLRSLIHV